jgi:hypothetical protein
VFEYARKKKFERGDFMSQEGVVRLSSHIARECASMVLETVPITMLVQAVKQIESAL